MDRPFPVATIASCFALAGFAVAIFGGLAAERDASGILTAALMAMTACYALGFGAARVAQVAVREHVALVQARLAARTDGAPGASGTELTGVDIIGDLPLPGASPSAERARST